MRHYHDHNRAYAHHHRRRHGALFVVGHYYKSLELLRVLDHSYYPIHTIVLLCV
jgi:hypothetical protein